MKKKNDNMFDVINVFNEELAKVKKGLRVAIYVRVSTEEQATNGFSISGQIEKLTAYSSVKDYYVQGIYIDDGRSGKDIEGRPELQNLMKDIEKGLIDIVLVFKIDRLTRSTRDLIDLVEFFNQNDCQFCSLSENIDTLTASGRMFLKIVGIFAEFERENLIERVKFGFERKVQEGYTLATRVISYGYDLPKGEKIMQINEEEAKIVQYIYDLFTEESHNEYDISNKLNDIGIKSKRGKKWSPASVLYILTNPNLIGKVRHHLYDEKLYKEYEGKHQPIINIKQYEKAQELLKKRVKNVYVKKSKDKSYYKSFLECGCCSGKFRTHHNVKRSENSEKNEDYISYICSNRIKKQCSSKIISHIKVEEAFINYINNLEQLVLTDELIINKTKIEKDTEKEIKDISKKIEKSAFKKKEIMTQYISEIITFEEYQAMNILLQSQEIDLNNKLNELNSINNDNEEDYTIFNKEIVLNIKENWIDLSDKEKFNFLTQFIEKIVVEIEPIENKKIYKAKVKEIRFYK